MKFKFNKTKIGFSAKMSKLLMKEIDTEIGYIENDFIRDLVTVKIEAFVLEQMLETKDLEYWRPPQKFWDWARRRPQVFKFTFNCREILHEPPLLPPGKSTLLYEVKEL